MKVYKEKYVADAYKQILTDLYHNPEFVTKPRDQEVREIINCIIEIEEPNFNLYKNKIRSSPSRYIAGEYLWYFSGTNNPLWIERNFKKAGEFWSKLHNNDGTVNSAYGNLIFTETNTYGFTQYKWALESLKRDKDTRQAFMHFNKPHHQYFENKDQVCTLSALFHIRKNKLNMIITMRSNDIIRGFITDFAFFNMLQQQMHLHLKKYYPELKIGSYTHISHSMHLYSEHYELVENMLQHDFEITKTPTLNKSIIDERGWFLNDYRNIFLPINYGVNYELDIDYATDNDVISWCVNKLKK